MNILCTENFRKALAARNNPRKFIEILAEHLGSHSACLLTWAESFARDEDLKKRIHQIMKERGITDEWKFLTRISREVSSANNSESRDASTGATGVRGAHSRGTKAAREEETRTGISLIGKEVNEVLHTMVSTIAGTVAAESSLCIIIHGERQYGKTTFLATLQDVLEHEHSLVVVHFREHTRNHGGSAYDIMLFDDVDIELACSADQPVDTRIIRYYTNKNMVMVLTCTNKDAVKKIITVCGGVVYTIPALTGDEIQHIISHMPIRGLRISPYTAQRVYELLTAFGVRAILPKAIETVRMLLYPYLRKQAYGAEHTLPLDPDEEALHSALSMVTGMRVYPATPETETKIRYEITRRLKGQQQVIEELLPHLVSITAGLTDPARPAGVFFFYGPTGCGKTEMAYAIANGIYNGVIHKEDMNTYSEKHSVSRLTGSPPGYMGYDDSTSLIDHIDAHPRGVLLFDEIEKAHAVVKDHIMELLDNGILRDAKGKEHNARNCVIVLTSNVTFGHADTRVTGFNQSHNQRITSNAREELQATKAFKNEFIDRLDVIARFSPLAEADVKQVAALLLDELITRLRSIGLSTDKRDAFLEEVYAYYQEHKSTRTMKRYIETEIKNKIIMETTAVAKEVTHE